MNYKESVEYIHSLLAFGIKPGLERISLLLKKLGNPQEKIDIVHVAGTNGKGSTSTMLANCLRKTGKKTGLYTSPYVISFCERIQIDGKNIDENIFAENCTLVKSEIEKLNSENIIITEFEAITAIAFLCFYKEGCDCAVVEVGLGGRFDATNVIKKPKAVVIASISRDHTAILGDTLEKIAFEKCGIIKENSHVFTSAKQKPKVLSLIKDTTWSRNGVITVTEPKSAKIIEHTPYGTKFLYKNKEYELSLAGAHQVENALNVIETASYLGVSYEDIFNGIKETVMIARMEIIGEKPLIIRDGGHNEGCGKALYKYLTDNNIKNIIAVVGMMADKDTEKYLRNVASLCDCVITTTPSNPRAMNCKNLLYVANNYCCNVLSFEKPKEAYKKALKLADKNSTVLVCGSFYLMSDIFGDN